MEKVAIDARKEIGARLRSARKAARKTQKEVAAVIEKTSQAVSGYETGVILPNLSNMHAIADFLGVSFAWLVSGKGIQEAGPIPTLVPAGDFSGIDVIQSPSAMFEPVVSNRNGAQKFCLRMISDALAPEIRAGDDVLCAEGLEPLPGAYVVVSFGADGDTLLRKYRPTGEKDTNGPIFELWPENPLWPRIRVSEENPGQIKAVVVELRRYCGRMGKVNGNE